MSVYFGDWLFGIRQSPFSLPPNPDSKKTLGWWKEVCRKNQLNIYLISIILPFLRVQFLSSPRSVKSGFVL